MKLQNKRAMQILPGKISGEKLTFEEFESQLASFQERGYVGEVKFDGLRYLNQVYPNGSNQCFLTSRRKSVITGCFVEKQDKVSFIRDHPWNKELSGTVFDGEFVSEGISSDTQHAMAQGKGDYYCWDILFYQGLDIRDWTRTRRRRVLTKILTQSCLPEWFHIVPGCKNLKGFFKYVKAFGLEGGVLKHPDSKYGEDWIAFKQKKTHDCVIIGYKDSTEGKYAKKGWIKSVLIAQYTPCSRFKMPQKLPRARIKGIPHYLIPVGKTSGMTENLRRQLSNNKQQFLHTPIEVAAQLRLPSGKFRHPRWQRFREDKNPKDCIW